MDSLYSAQNEYKKEHGLTKVRAIHNQNYKRNGTKVGDIYRVRILVAEHCESTGSNFYLFHFENMLTFP